MKYSRSAITQLTKWYKQVLIKCAVLNAAIFIGAFGIPSVADATEINQNGVPFKRQRISLIQPAVIFGILLTKQLMVREM